MKIITLTEKEFDDYASHHKYRNFYQTSSYGKAMEPFGYKTHLLGIKNDYGKLIGASLLLYKEVFMNYKLAYAPRGILFDYTDAELLKEFTERLKKLLSKQGFMYLKIDPAIPICLRDSTGKIINMNREANIILENLKANNYVYHGQTLYFETEKARFEAIVTLNDNIRNIYQQFEKNTRYKIKKAAKNGVEVYKSGPENLELFYNLVKRKHTKTLEYYQELYKHFGNNIELYFAKLNTETFVITNKKAYETELERNDDLTKKIQQAANTKNARRKLINEKIESDKLVNVYKKNLLWATELLKTNPDGVIIGTAMTICYDNTAFLFIEAFDKSYKNLNPNYLIKWKMINEYKNRNFKYLNLNAVSGEFKKDNKFYGLNEMKLGFHAVVSEYIGEFDLIINSLAYSLYRNLNKGKKK